MALVAFITSVFKQSNSDVITINGTVNGEALTVTGSYAAALALGNLADQLVYGKALLIGLYVLTQVPPPAPINLNISG